MIVETKQNRVKETIQGMKIELLKERDSEEKTN